MLLRCLCSESGPAALPAVSDTSRLEEQRTEAGHYRQGARARGLADGANIGKPEHATIEGLPRECVGQADGRPRNGGQLVEKSGGVGRVRDERIARAGDGCVDHNRLNRELDAKADPRSERRELG